MSGLYCVLVICYLPVSGTMHHPLQAGSADTGMTALGDSPSYYQYSAQGGYRARKRWRQNGREVS